MTDSEHVFLSGNGAEEFGRKFEDIKFQKPEYFYTDVQWNNLQKALKHDSLLLDQVEVLKSKKIGTVGAVALDL